MEEGVSRSCLLVLLLLRVGGEEEEEEEGEEEEEEEEEEGSCRCLMGASSVTASGICLGGWVGGWVGGWEGELYLCLLERGGSGWVGGWVGGWVYLDFGGDAGGVEDRDLISEPRVVLKLHEIIEVVFARGVPAGGLLGVGGWVGGWFLIQTGR